MPSPGGSKKKGKKQDPLKAWLLAEAKSAEEDEDDSVAEAVAGLAGKALPEEQMIVMVPSPKANVGFAPEPQQRVIQIGIGSEHGIMLTDAGIVFSWGDNKYGQLGRTPCLKEEDGTPFPILNLLDEEITQVAAGKNHCLALTATGLVWAWGRNKDGQVGCGDARDKVFPVKVCHAPENEDAAPEPLGQKRTKKQDIIQINAGGNSSIAAARCALVWQWGEICGCFKEASKGGSKEQAKYAKKDRPYLAMADPENYRTGQRQKTISVAETGCKVIENMNQAEQVKDMLDSVRKLIDDIHRERSQLKTLDFQSADLDRKKKQKLGEPDGNEMNNLNDTIAVIQREISRIDQDIDVYKKNFKSCEEQSAHHRDQLESLMSQGKELSDAQDSIGLKIYTAKKGGQERRKLEEKLAEIREFVEANQNTRMTLLDQRAETDKEKQHLQRELNNKLMKRDNLSKRLIMVKDLGKSAGGGTGGVSDWGVSFLKQQKDVIASHYDFKKPPQSFVAAMRELESDEAFLNGVQNKMNEAAGNSEDAEKMIKLSGMLQELVNLRKAWGDLLADKWLKEGNDMASFFEGAKRPTDPDEMESSAHGGGSSKKS
eukprot:gnl/TRDRNA2_/TRDRNA2_156743_c0_seq1.p1 gnl/TRDRNA2_/TRDRNA2_156743_c0~~gnl/TRDRNA2_/TRDRNA2_156743_c0_seq1.p1  ORF type:complete len:623 (+),score=139.66 gnl/TRDRNA2_/TRDRNA2_156743_c0_seq1:70-1869(+)